MMLSSASSTLRQRRASATPCRAAVYNVQRSQLSFSASLKTNQILGCGVNTTYNGSQLSFFSFCRPQTHKDAKLCTTNAYPVAVPASSPTPRGYPQRHVPRRPSRAPLVVGRHQQAERLATSCAAENCTATERRCVVNAMYVRADHVVSSYSDAVQLVGAPLRPPCACRLCAALPSAPT